MSTKALQALIDHASETYPHLESERGQQDLAAAREALAKYESLVGALEGLFEHCAMVHKHWGEGSNATAADTAISEAREALARAKGA